MRKRFVRFVFVEKKSYRSILSPSFSFFGCCRQRSEIEEDKVMLQLEMIERSAKREKRESECERGEREGESEGVERADE